MPALKTVFSSLAEVNGRLWRRSKILWFVGLLVVVCILCAVCGSVISILPGSGTRTASVAPTSVPGIVTREPASLTPSVDGGASANATGTSIAAKILATLTAVAPTKTSAPTMPPARVTALATSISATVAPAQSAKGLGVSRASIQARFETVGFVFKNSPLLDGTPRVIANAPNENVLLELIGPAEEVTKASLILFAAKDDPQANARGAVYMLALLAAVTPEWDKGTDWLTENLKAAIAGDEATTLVGSKRVTLSADPTLGAITLIFAGE